MSRAIKIISEFPTSNDGIKMVANAIVDGVMSGEVDPLDVRARIESIEKIMKAVKDDVAFKDAVLDQADLHPDKTFEHNGIGFTKADSVKYDYSDDSTWREAKGKEAALAAARKAREAFLKALQGPVEMDGELIQPPAKHSSAHVRLTFR